MHRKSLIASTVILLAAGLVACGGGGGGNNDADPAAPPQSVGDTLALTASGRLFSFNRTDPATVVGSVTVSGLGSGETLLGIDVRPADGLLYALSSAGKVYTVEPSTGVATLKSTLAADVADASSPFVALAGERFGIDFNPTVDRLRVVGTSGQNLRINVDSGATTTDGVINLAGSTPTVGSVAYSNSFDGATATQLFDLNSADSLMYQQTPPNNGTLASGVTLGVSFTEGEFDIDPVSNVGYAALTVGGASQLYTVNLAATSGAATLVGTIAGTESVIGLALNTPAPAATVLALTTDGQLLSFDPRTPNTLASTVSLAAPVGESVVGIDIRPIDGLLYAVTQDAGNIGRVYSVDTATGGLTPVATINVLLSGSSFSVDFNPAANALRVISETGQSLAVNLTTSPGTATVNGSVNYAGVPAASVIAAAYLNSGVSATQPAATTLYSIEASTDALTTQAVATGTLTLVGALGRDATATAGFDIAGNRNGRALAAFGASGSAPYVLYEVNLSTGATILPRGLTADSARIGGAAGPALRDLAIRF